MLGELKFKNMKKSEPHTDSMFLVVIYNKILQFGSVQYI